MSLKLLDALGLDLERSLSEEPRFLIDAHFLGALHAELREGLSAEEAEAALRQLGFATGLRDAGMTMRDGLGGGSASAGLRGAPPTPVALAIRLDPVACTNGNLGVDGAWPELHEAEAVIQAVGDCEHPACAASAGYTSGWLSGIFGADLVAIERHCAASGDTRCQFEAREADHWREHGDARVERVLDALPFDALREAATRALQQPANAAPPPSEGFEPGSPAVHVWGPVMVLPFSGADESLRAVELIGRDPAARGVRVVVVDLSGAILDEGFGAVALEQVLDAITQWGAEPLLTGISPLSEPTVASLEQSHVVLRKDLEEAIAVAYQIAEAQKRSV